IIAVCLLVLASSCGNEKKEKLFEERISMLEKQLDECKNGEDRIVGRIKNHVQEKQHDLVITAVNELSQKFPGSSFLADANNLKLEATQSIENARIEQQKKIEAEREKKRASLKKLKTDHDDVSGVTWYKQRYFTHYNDDNRTSVYMGKQKGSAPWIRLKMSYSGDSWIFYEQAYLSYDGNTREFIFRSYDDKKSDNGYDCVIGRAH